jgi:hypothetical protein
MEKNGENKTCTICGKEYYTKRRYAKLSKYCSKECWSKRNPPIEIECLKCGKTFTDYKSNKKKFCSKDCANKFMERRVKLTCKICNKEYESKQSKSERGGFCSVECSSMAQIGENNVSWQGGKSKMLYGDGWNKTLKDGIKKRDNNTCQICNKVYKTGKSFTVHHIDYNKKNHEENNLILLCNSCHTMTNFNRNSWINYFKK